MAEGWIRYYHGDKIKVFSAGLEAHGINPYMKQVMKLADVNIDSHTSNTMKEYENQQFDFVFTVCDNAKDNCPYFSESKYKIHQAFEDPADATGTDEQKLITYAKVRDQIQAYCKELTF
jgi:arsenate reductase